MQVSPTLALVLVGLSSALAVFAVIAWVRFLFGDRAKGRPRCPACWYSMQGIAHSQPSDATGLRCPECGHCVHRLPDLFRVRRSRLLIVLGILAMTASGAVSFPVWRNDALTAEITPTWLLVHVVPVGSDGHGSLAIALDRELSNRARLRPLSDDQISVLARRKLSIPGIADELVELPKTLRRNGSCRLMVEMLHGMSEYSGINDDLKVRARVERCIDGRPGNWIEESAYFLEPPSRCISGIPLAESGVPVEIEVHIREMLVWKGRVVKPVKWSDDVEPILTPDSRPLDQLLSEMPRVYLGGVNEPPMVSMIPPPAMEISDDDVAFGITVQVLRNDRVVAGGEYASPLRWSRGMCGNEYGIPDHVGLQWAETPPTHLEPDDRWIVRFVGNDDLAAMDFDPSSFRSRPAPTKYWAGTHDFSIDKLVDPWKPE